MKRTYLWVGICLALIPVVLIGAVVVHGMIDPEIAARHANYERNYRLLESIRSAVFHGALLVMLALWFAACVFLARTKDRSVLWATFGVLGPLGFAVIAALRSRAGQPEGPYQSFIARLGTATHIAFELLLFVAIVSLSIAAVSLHEDVMIAWAAHAQGVSVEEIVRERDASSGMYAFSELLETIYVIVCLYFVVPLVANGIHRILQGQRVSTVDSRSS